MLKSYLLLLTTSSLLLLSSCLTVKFTSPQPKNGKLLEAFPDKLIGEWKRFDDSSKVFLEKKSISIEKNQFYFTKDSIKKDVNILSDSLQLYAKRDLYVINVLENETWMIIIVDVISNNEFHTYLLENLSVLINDRHLKPVELSDGDESLNPDDEDFNVSTVDDALFEGQMSYKTLKRCMRNNESRTVFKRLIK